MKRWLRRSPHRWDWLQVEVSSQCHAACIYCPTAIYRHEGANLIMALETFQKLRQAFSKTHLVYLQGWGEPFLNPDIFEMVRMVKAAGCQAGMTTNGMLLNAARLAEIIHSGIDVITFSLAGCDEANNVVRKGTRLARVIEIIRQLKILKQQLGVSHPEIHIAYMLLRSGLAEIERLPYLLADSGVAQVVISTLDFIPSPALEQETLIPSNQEEFTSWQVRLYELTAAGRKLNIDIHYQMVSFGDGEFEDPSLAPGDLNLTALLSIAKPTCTEHIQNAAFISAGGDVTPCVFTHLPIVSPEIAASHMAKPYQPMIFGNIHDRPLEDIWETKAYQGFRRSHRAGHLIGACQTCLKPRLQIF